MFRARRLHKLINRFFLANDDVTTESPDLLERWFIEYIENLEKAKVVKLERDKVEKIMRDLLKANVFKQA